MGDEAITISGDIVTKVGPPELMRIEIEKTRRAYRIAQECGRFRVPQVLDYDASTGTAKLEYIHPLMTLREAMAAGELPPSFMEDFAEGLLVVHENLVLPQDMAAPLPAEYADTAWEGFLHGDLGLRNVCVGAKDPRVVLLDWQATVKLGSRATYGSRYFDLAWFIYNLFYRPAGRDRYRSHLASVPLADRFLRRYLAASGRADAAAEFSTYMRRFLGQKRSQRKEKLQLKRRLVLIPSHLRLRRFIGSFHV